MKNSGYEEAFTYAKKLERAAVEHKTMKDEVNVYARRMRKKTETFQKTDGQETGTEGGREKPPSKPSRWSKVLQL